MPDPSPPFHVTDYRTSRLLVTDWHATLDDETRRRDLEHDLRGILSPRVLEHLPDPLKQGLDHETLDLWMSALAAEAQVLCVTESATSTRVGLLICATEPASTGALPVHIGYVLSEAAWGKGFATELITGLIDTLGQDSSVRLVAGVDRKNPASIQVLRKSGFDLDRALSDADTAVYTRPC